MEEIKSSGKHCSPGEELAIEFLTNMSIKVQKIKDGEINNISEEANKDISELDKRFNNLEIKEKEKFFALIKSQTVKVISPIALQKIPILPVFNKPDKKAIIVLSQCKYCLERNTCNKPWKK